MLGFFFSSNLVWNQDELAKKKKKIKVQESSQGNEMDEIEIGYTRKI